MQAAAKRYRLGLDLGTNSIGWWAVTLDAADKPNGSLAAGVRIFGDGRNPKDGSSLAVERRVPRGMRRRRDRYLRRRAELIEELIVLRLMPADERERRAVEKLDPYDLRAQALDRPLAPHELGRVLFHLDQRRGFKSNRKTDKPEDNKLTARIDELRRRIAMSGGRTLGEFLHKRRLKGKMVRARSEAGFYPDRALYEDEFAAIRKAQEAHQALRSDQWDSLKDIVFFQRPLKPVDPGWCLLEEGERRAHRALPCAQEFRMVQETNNLRILVPGEAAKDLTREQRDKVLAALRTRKDLKLEDLVKLLKLPSGARINLLDEIRKTLKGDETAHRLSNKALFGKTWHTFSFERRTVVVRKLLETEQPAEIERLAQADWGLDEAAAKRLATTPLPEGYARLSEKAIAKLLPIMEEQGLRYADAVAQVPEYGHHSDFRSDTALDRLPYYGAALARHAVGGDATKPKTDEVGHYGRIANPTVHIGLGQLRRVVNRLIELYGKPEEIVVELARELKLNKEERDSERQKNAANEEANGRRRKQIESARVLPSPDLLRKLRLWEEQTFGSVHVCPFTGETISFEMAISDATEIEHVLPFSKTLDDSMANKVVCLRAANRDKKDRSPYEAFGSSPVIGGRSYDYVQILLRADALPPNKRWRFYPDAMDRFKDEPGFLDRQLNETKYLSRIARVYLAHLYNEKAEGRLRVRAIPGRLTAMLRGKWGLNALLRGHNLAGDEDVPRKNREDHRHHALDAFVIAMTDQGLLKRVSDLNSDSGRKRLIEAVPEPWSGFSRDDLRAQIDRMTVSYKPDRGTPGRKGKTTGALHNDTAYGLVAPATEGRWTVVSRVALASLLTPKDMDNALPAVRDATLRHALIAEWEAFKQAVPKAADKADPEAVKKKKNPAALFAARLATEGVRINGRAVKVRRVRMVDELAVIPIADRRTGKPYKGYRPDANEFAEVWRLPDGDWRTVIVRRFDANQPGFDLSKLRPHPAARKLFRLQIDDLGAIYEGAERRIVRVCKMSSGGDGERIFLAEHNEANVDARVRKKELRYLTESANGLRKKSFRKVGVDAIGRLTDPGPVRAPDAT